MVGLYSDGDWRKVEDEDVDEEEDAAEGSNACFAYWWSDSIVYDSETGRRAMPFVKGAKGERVGEREDVYAMWVGKWEKKRKRRMVRMMGWISKSPFLVLFHDTFN
jgi:hypothetical protein